MRVLIVDDEADIRELVRRVLQRADAGIDVVEAGTGEAALAAMAENPADVAIVDLHLPDGSGLDVVAPLRALRPALKVIMLSGSTTAADRARGLDSGAHEYVDKPFSATDLAALVLALGRSACGAPSDGAAP